MAGDGCPSQWFHDRLAAEQSDARWSRIRDPRRRHHEQPGANRRTNIRCDHLAELPHRRSAKPARGRHGEIRVLEHRWSHLASAWHRRRRGSSHGVLSMTTHLVGFLLSLSVPLQYGTAPPTANEDVGRAALESSVAGQAWRARFSMRVTVDFGLDRGRGLEYQRSTALVRCAGEKLDITTDFTLLDSPAGKPKSSLSNTKFRYVSDGRWWTSRNLVTGVISTRSAEFRNSATRAIESHQYGFGLDGHFPGQARTTLVEALLDAKQRKVETRSVDGADCVVVSGSTAYGKAEVCLDPARDHVLVAARMEKFP